MINKKLISTIQVAVCSTLLFCVIRPIASFAISQSALDSLLRNGVWYNPADQLCSAQTASPADVLAALQNVPEFWRNLITNAAELYPDVDARLVATTLWVENRSWPDPNKDWATSSAGAKGPWQFIDSSWASMGRDGDGDGVADVNNPADAVLGAFEHQRGSANLPIAAEYDGNPESSFNKIVFQRDRKNLLSFAASYNGGAAQSGYPLNTFPRSWEGGGRDSHELENTGYIVMSYWLLATGFTKTSNNEFTELIDVSPEVAVDSNAQAGSGASGSCVETGGGAIEGLESPPNLGQPDANGLYELPENPDLYRIYAGPADRKGKLELIQVIYTVAKAWRQRHADSWLSIGDLNASSGHKSHKKGIDVDLDVVNSEGQPVAGDFVNSPDTYSKELSIELGSLFVDTKIVTVIYFNDSDVQAAVNEYAATARKDGDLGFIMKYWQNHDNHFHVRIFESG